MPVIEFENREQATLLLVIEPQGERYEIPHLAVAGLRYSLGEGLEERCISVVSEHRIDFWCGADSYEVDIVHPETRARLSWDICLNGGWCGGIVDDEPTTFEDLLPETGPVTAREFAVAVIRADGWPVDEPLPDEHLRWLEAKFIEHLGAAAVDVEVLRRLPRIPFK